MSLRKIRHLLQHVWPRALPLLLFIAVACKSTNSLAAETPSSLGVQLGIGIGSHQTQIADLAVVWDPKLQWCDNGTWHCSLIGEVHLAQWRVLHHKNVTELGITPVFLYSQNAGSIRPYIEAGIGVRLLSRAGMADNYTLSSGFQFADMIGAGATFGPSMRYKVGLRLQHISNAGIKRPNPGINFAQAFFQYHF